MKEKFKRIENKSLGFIVYYIKMVKVLYDIPLKLRVCDVQKLAGDIQKVREASDKELAEYLAHVKSYIKE